MLYHFLYPMGSDLILFNVFRYISFRAVMATLTALMISYLLGRPVVDYLRAFQIGQTVRDDGPKSHLEKSGTPTMGGLLILFAMTFSCLLWTRLDNVYFWIVLGVTLTYGAIGFLDDYLKVTKQSHRGLSGKRKLGLQLIVGCVVGLVLWLDPSFKTTLTVPFFKNFNPDLGIWYIPFVALVIAGASNAVNLTDGMDGLASGCVALCALVFLILTYIVGTQDVAAKLLMPHVPKSGELVILCGAILGSCLGFLWYNCHPARVFMGDTGSLPLGGLIGYVAVVTRQELMLLLAGGIFVIEAVSVMVQIGYFKWSAGRRIFRCAPIHHHFHLGGWSEPQTVVRFWLVAAMFAGLALASIKLR